MRRFMIAVIIISLGLIILGLLPYEKPLADPPSEASQDQIIVPSDLDNPKPKTARDRLVKIQQKEATERKKIWEAEEQKKQLAIEKEEYKRKLIADLAERERTKQLEEIAVKKIEQDKYEENSKTRELRRPRNHTRNSSVWQVKDWMKENLPDPKSTEYIYWYPVVKRGDDYTVRCLFRSKNRLGVYEIADITFSMRYKPYDGWCVYNIRSLP